MIIFNQANHNYFKKFRIIPVDYFCQNFKSIKILNTEDIWIYGYIDIWIYWIYGYMESF